MSDSNQQSQPEFGISWGKVLVGAAIAAGAVAAFVIYPELGIKMVEGVKAAAGFVYEKAGDAASWAWNAVVGTANVSNINHAANLSADLAAKQAIAQQGGNAGISAAFDIGAIKNDLAAATKAVAETSSGLIGFIVQNKILAVATAAVGGGMFAAKVSAADNALAPAMQKSYSREELIRRDMEARQAYMMARMMANGYGPAMATQGHGAGR